ncbi:type II toxin-antitoxin system death-on-curing family toxin [Thermodesulforhabdus norvegica]|uniref:type II toxin-antitoxin system death-on-curing family toxin n=1 Tax=Thermodesulforhabdus norvegica TaxID=39841 RepID=UPI001FE1AE41|nr:type II toxin-antitoxin system death-on-curing family toxin [Thermodesulforhabdus norvegica]
MHPGEVRWSRQIPGLEVAKLGDSTPPCRLWGNGLYRDLFTKAAALGYSLVLNQPFLDGNKRTAWEAMHTFVEENRHSLRAGPDEIVELMLCIEDKSLGASRSLSGLKNIFVS